MGAWAVWRLPRSALGFVAVIEAAAVVVSVATAFAVPVSRADLVRAAVLAATAVAAIELTRQVERQREYVRDPRVAYVDTKSVWSIAAVIVLPPALATGLVVWTYLVAWLRIWPGTPPGPLYRWLFSCATVLCGTQAAVAVLAAGMRHYPGIPVPQLWPGLADVAVLLAALLLRWAINTALVMVAIGLSTPETTVRGLFTGFSQQLLEAGGAGLGVAAAVLVVVSNPFVLVAIVIALVAVHHGILLSHHQLAGRLDVTTGVYGKRWWTAQAERLLAASRDTAVGLLMIDLDHFKQVNDTHGHADGDLVLRAVAGAIATAVRHEDDVVGRFGGEEFVLLAAGIGTADNLAALAERIRLRVRTVSVVVPGAAEPVTGLTVSIGAALHPAPGVDGLDDLVRAADHALYQAKRGGRDRIHLAAG